MRNLDEAWKWYEDVKRSLKRIHRVGKKYWNVIPWDESPWRSDGHFAHLQQSEVTEPAQSGLDHLDDLAVVVLFSVFEAVVRGLVLTEVEEDVQRVRHPVVVKALRVAKKKVNEGSFFTILESYKGPHSNLIEEVSQVRRYRNWVSHGRRNARPPSVSPLAAYERLTDFMQMFFPEPTVSNDLVAEWIEGVRGNAD